MHFKIQIYSHCFFLHWVDIQVKKLRNALQYEMVLKYVIFECL